MTIYTFYNTKLYSRLRLALIGLIAVCSFSVKAQTGGGAIIYPDVKIGNTITEFYFDIKNGGVSVGSNARAQQLFVDHDMNGIRVPIFGNIDAPAHPSAGTVVESEYTGILNAINRAKAARPDLKVFASKKLNGQNSFPNWVKDANGVIPAKYAILLADYIQFMNDKGIQIDYLGVDNESMYNEGNITPTKFKNIVDELKTLAVSRGFDMPVVVGYEDYLPKLNNWMKGLSDINALDRMQIYGTHYYPKWRPYGIKSNLITDLGYVGNKPFWSTEPHWDSAEDGNTNMDVAEQAMCSLWDQIELGMSGFMWWAYGGSDKVRENLMFKTSIPLRGAHMVDMDDLDGKSTTTLGKLQTRAFREGNILTVVALNMTPNNLTDYQFSLNHGNIIGNVSYTQFTDATPETGNSATATLVNASTYSLTLPSRSITFFSINIGASFQETFGTGSGNVTDLVNYTGYTTKTPTDFGFTYSASGAVDIRSTQNSTGYTGASGGRHLFYPKTAGAYFQIAGINTSALAEPTLAFGIKRGSAGGSASDMAVEYSLDGGTNWTPLDLAAKITSFPATWMQVAFTLPQTQDDKRLAIRFRRTTTVDNFFIDDISVGEATEFSVLPVQLASFSATKSGSTAILQWTTQTESNNSHFDIERSLERSLDGVTFTVIGTKQGAGNSSVAQNYRFTDYNPAGGTNYYRLVQHDNNGHATVYGVKAVSFDVGGTGMQILAGGNPQQISFSLQTAKGSNAQFALYSVDGKKIAAQNIEIKAGNNIYTANVPYLSPGVYVAVLQLSGNTYKAKLIK